MTCAQPGCHRAPRPGFAHCDDDTRRLLRDAFAHDLSPTDATSSEARDTLSLPPGPLRRSRPSLAAASAVSRA